MDDSPDYFPSEHHANENRWAASFFLYDLLFFIWGGGHGATCVTAFL